MDVRLSFACANSTSAPSYPGVNTLLLSASTTPVPDIVALAATATHNGIVDVPGPTGTEAFAVASVNVGVGGTITTSADTAGAGLPVTMSLCRSDPASGQCVSAAGSTVTEQIDPGATQTYSIFVTGHDTVPFDPARNRIFVRFKDAGDVVRGATSVAVETKAVAPSIVGTYGGSANFTQTACQNPIDNGAFVASA